jgi:hypothetical protein
VSFGETTHGYAKVARHASVVHHMADILASVTGNAAVIHVSECIEQFQSWNNLSTRVRVGQTLHMSHHIHFQMTRSTSEAGVEARHYFELFNLHSSADLILILRCV